MFQEIQKTAIRHQLQASIVGHIGSGILYSGFFTGEHDSWHDEAQQAMADLVKSADRLGGFFLVEGGPPEMRQTYDLISQRSDYALMLGLKRSFDPRNIFNPGKMVRV